MLISNLKPYLGGSKTQFLAAHIRRGDYLLEKHSIHGLIDEKYVISSYLKIVPFSIPVFRVVTF